MSKVLIGLGALLGVFLVGVLLFVVTVGITAAIVALAWNTLGLHEVVGAAALTTQQVFAVAIGIGVVRGIASRIGGTRST